MPKPTSNVFDLSEARARTRGSDLTILPRSDEGPVGGLPPEWRTPKDASGSAPGTVAPNLPSLLPNLHRLWIVGAGNMAQRSRNATSDERGRWASFLRRLAADENLTDAQRDAALDVWQRAIETDPNVMYPTVHIDPASRTLHFSWNPRPLSFEIEIDGEGRLEWYFADYDTGSIDGTSDPQRELEAKALTLLRLFRRAEELGRVSARR